MLQQPCHVFVKCQLLKTLTIVLLSHCSFCIVLEFQTASSVGVLLYLRGSVYADFIALQIKAGRLVFSFNLGSGRVDIESENQYNDGMKHTV